MTAMDYRQYDNALGRFNSIDALAEEDYDFTPYRFAYDNPLYWNDPTGLIEQSGNDITGWVNNKGKIFWDPKVNNQDDARKLHGDEANYVPDGTVLPNNDGTSTQYNSDGTKTTILSDVVVSGKPKQKSNSPGFSPWGPSLIGLGQPLDFLKPVGALGSQPGSSIASWTLEKAIPYRSPVLKQTTRKVVAKVVGKRIAKKTGTAVVGRFLGRLVPWVGWGIFTNDVYQNRELLKGTISAGAADYYEMQERARNGGVDENGVPLPIVCFTKGTLIYGKDKFIPIEDIKIGDIVYSYNIEKNKLEFGNVTKTFERTTEIIYELNISKETINVTAEHPFYVNGQGWVKVKDLKKGDIVKCSQEELKIERIKKISKKVVVYNIEVDGNHNYFITTNMILVHNKSVSDINYESETKTKKL